MEPQIVLRQIASSAVDFIELLDACRANRYARTNRSAIAFGADQLEQHAVIAVLGAIDQQCRRLAHIEDSCI